MKQLLLMTLGLCTLIASAGERHIFLLIGQSNMAGRGAIPDEWNRELEGVELWNGKGWITAKPAYNRFAPHKKSIFTGMNPGPSFAAAWRAAHPDATVGIICYARGGTKIEEWEKGLKKPRALYDDAIAATQEAAKTGTIKGVLWHQGEGNSSKSIAYPKKLSALVENLRADLGADLPVVYGQLGAWRDSYADFNAMLLKQPARIPNTACVSSEGLPKKDDAHFSGAAHVTFGERYAEAMLKLTR